MTRRALVCGVLGQDGSYLAEQLLARDYSVTGTTRDSAKASDRSEMPSTVDAIDIVTMQPTDFRSVLSIVERTRPDEIYALAGQSSVGYSFEEPAETLKSIVFGILNILEAVRTAAPAARVYHASSSECFGDLKGWPATETTPFDPRSPYGVAKSSAHMLVRNYREAYGLFASNGLLFNHESPRRPARFVTRKIIDGAARIARGDGSRLVLGNLDIVRDWGWAPEYTDAMWRILQADAPDDFIIATGESRSLSDFTAAAFAIHGLDWRSHVDIDARLGRPSDLAWSGADPSRAAALLGWRASARMDEVVRRMASNLEGSAE